MDALEGAGEVFGDQRAHLFCLLVIGIVVAGRERVGTEHNAALDLCAEPVLACLLQRLPYVVRVAIRIAIFDAVVTSKISAGFCRSYNIVSCKTVFAMRQGKLADLCSQFTQPFNVLTHGPDYSWLRPLYPVFLGN